MDRYQFFKLYRPCFLVEKRKMEKPKRRKRENEMEKKTDKAPWNKGLRESGYEKKKRKEK